MQLPAVESAQAEWSSSQWESQPERHLDPQLKRPLRPGEQLATRHRLAAEPEDLLPGWLQKRLVSLHLPMTQLPMTQLPMTSRSGHVRRHRVRALTQRVLQLLQRAGLPVG
jgi:hypothetical protein